MDGSGGKSFCCASRGPGFSAQHQHDGSQSSLTSSRGSVTSSMEKGKAHRNEAAITGGFLISTAASRNLTCPVYGVQCGGKFV